MGQTATQTMRADTKALTGTGVDVAPVLGTWVNAKRHTDHISMVTVTDRGGDVFARLYGAADEPIDWGEARAVPYAFTGTSEVAGFHTQYALGAARIEIAANVKLGILVIQTYTTFSDGRVSQFSREFFYRRDVQRPPDTPSRTGRTFLLGDWVNTYPDTRWLKSFTLADTGNAITVRVEAAREPTNWGEAEVTTYLDGAGEPAFHTRYDLGLFEAVLAGNTGKDIIIVEAFLRHQSDESANTVCREFFVPS
jgi:hypothetical protein